jgi:hypothetical protein
MFNVLKLSLFLFCVLKIRGQLTFGVILQSSKYGTYIHITAFKNKQSLMEEALFSEMLVERSGYNFCLQHQYSILTEITTL